MYHVYPVDTSSRMVGEGRRAGTRKLVRLNELVFILRSIAAAAAGDGVVLRYDISPIFSLTKSQVSKPAPGRASRNTVSLDTPTSSIVRTSNTIIYRCFCNQLYSTFCPTAMKLSFNKMAG